MLNKATMDEALHAAASPYKELDVFNSELMTLHSQHFPRAKRSRSGNGKGKESLLDKIKAIKDSKGSAKDKSKATDNSSKGKGSAKKS